MKKRILLLHYYFPPLAGAVTNRISKIIHHLSNTNKYELTTITSRPDLIHFGYDYPLYESLKEETEIIYTSSLDPLYLLSGLKNTRKKQTKALSGIRKSPKVTLYTFFKNFCFPGDDKILWTPFVIKKAKQLHRKNPFDMIYTTFPPAGNLITAHYLKKALHIPLCIDYRDPWHYNSGALRFKTKLHFHLESLMEKKILKNTDAIVFNSPKTFDAYMHSYPFLEKKKSYFIANGYDDSQIVYQKPAIPSTETSLKLIIYGSTMGLRSPLPFLKIMNKMVIQNQIQTDQIHITICGQTSDTVLQFLKKSRLHYTYLGHLPQHTAIEKLNESHIALLSLAEGINRTLILNKVYDFIGTKKLIFFIGPDCMTKELVAEYNRSIITDVNRPEEIENHLLTLIKKPETYLNLSVNESIRNEMKQSTQFLKLEEIFHELCS